MVLVLVVNSVIRCALMPGVWRDVSAILLPFCLKPKADFLGWISLVNDYY
jgi:hypothetical protein